MKNFKKLKTTILIISALIFGISVSVLAATGAWRSVSASISSGDYSSALGKSEASGAYAISAGSATASGNQSVAFGASSIASAPRSVAMGFLTEASGWESTALGYLTKATQTASFAIGSHTVAAGYYQTAMGSYNIENTGKDQLLIVGNGYKEFGECITIDTWMGQQTLNCNPDTEHRSNAFVVGSDGKLYSNGNYPISDVRLKQNIKPINGALDKVLKLQGVYYDWKPEQKRFKGYGKEIGLIAQDVEKVVPELVHTDSTPDTKGRYLKSVAYEKTVALLIEGMKEQQKEIQELKKENKELLNRIKKLEK